MGLKDLELFAQQESERAGQSLAVNQSLTRGLDENPDEYAKLLKISAQTGIAPDLAKDFRPELEKRQKIQALSVDDLVRSNPKTAKFLANPDNAAVAQDDVQNLSVLEQILIKPIDYTRSIVEGVVGKGAGSTLSGAGELYGVASRSLEALLDKVLPNSVMSTLRTPVPWFMDPEQVLKRPGQTLKQAGEYVAPPKERQGLDTDVASGIGQIGFQIAQYLTTGGTLSAASMYSQGADVMATKTAKDEADPALRDTAIVTGAAITAITEKYGLDKILNRVPPEIKNRALRFIADKVAAGGIEAGQEIAEGLLHDLTRKVLTDENAPILEGALKEGTAAALSAAIVRAALGVRGYREAKQQEEVVKALSGDSKLRDRLPEKYQEFVASVTENGPVQNAYIPVEQFSTFFQSQGIDPEQIAEEIGVTNYREALAAGSEVVIPIDKFAANVAPTDYLQGLIPDLKFQQGAMTPRERQEWMAEVDAREAQLEASMQALVDEQTRQGGINQAIQEVVSDIEGQLRGAGYDASTAQSSATVMRGMAILAERDLRGRAQAEGREVTDEEILTAARQLWANSGLTVGRPMSGVLATKPTSDITIDPLLDALRAGAFPTDQQIFGRSLAEFVRDSGGLVPSGETLTADENMERRPFQKKLTQKDGMSLDKALEAAVQAGYFPGMTPGDLTEADFLNALDDDLRGSGVFSINVTDNNALAMREAMNQLSDYLDSLGIDLAAIADNAVVRQIIEQARNTPELEGVIGQLDQLYQRVLAGEVRTLPEQIEVDGVMRPTANSMGQQIHPTQEGVVNFWRWFGESKVVDEQGRPKVVYHATHRSFDAFAPSFRGAYFVTPSAEFANEYIDETPDDSDENSTNVMPLYVKAENTFDYDNSEHVTQVIEYLHRTNLFRGVQPGFFEGGRWDSIEDRQVQKAIKALGFDSFYVNENDTKNIGVYKPTQIKSATGNIGTFDPANDNILFQDEQLDLLIQHNLSAENLMHAVKMGGIPVPSLAVTKKDAPLTNFGEITLLGNKDLADPRGSGKPKVFGADIYSPRYPQINYKLDKASTKKLNEALAPYRQEGEREIYSSDIDRVDDLTSDKAFKRYADEKSGGNASWSQSKQLAAELLSNAGAAEKIFMGFTYSGNRKYIDHNIENVVKILKKELRGGEGFNYGVGSLRAKFTPEFKSIKAIRDNKDRLMSSAEFDKVKSEIDDEFVAIATGLDLSLDQAIEVFEDVPRMGAKRAIERALKDYNGGGEASTDQVSDVAEFVVKLRNLPTAYFEAKILRNVELSEFSGAVVPDNVDPQVIEALKSRGITDIRTYKAGDETDRAAQIGGFDNLFFQGQGLDDKRGFIQFGANRKFNIALLEKANLSTFLHESGHFYLEVLGDLATAEGAPENIRSDYAKILAFLGLESRDQLTLDGKEKGSAEYNRAVEAHEKFARANEAYLMEGKAPSVELQDIFQRFKSWMTLIYKQIGALNVKLNDEVREVFDRIYATEVEIQAAKDQVNVEALFLDAAAAGMSPQEFELYRASVAQATESGKEALTAKLMRQFMRERKEWWKEARAKMRVEVEQEVDGQLVYQAFKALVAGKMDDDTEIKLNKKSLIDKYGAEYVKRLPRGFARIYSAQGGMDADTAAEFLGYNSGDALIEALVGMRDRKELIEAETDVRMRETYGDLMTDGTIADEAKNALHNAERENVLMIELQALNKELGNRTVMPREALVSVARAMIGETAIKDLQPQRYLLASQKAARAAFKAMSEKNRLAAFEAKQKELLNHHLYIEANKAKEQADKILKYAAKFEKGTTREQMGKAGANYLEQIDALLDRYEFRRVPLSKIDRRASLAEWIAEQEAAGMEPSISAVLLNESRKVNYRQASVDELRAVYDAVRNIEHLARLKNKLLTKQGQIEFTDAIGELVASAEVAGERTPLPLDMSAMTMREKAGDTVSRLDAMLLKMEQVVEWLDGGNVNGPWHTYVWNPIAEAQTREYDLTRKLTERLATSLEAMPKEQRMSMLDTFEISGMGKVTRKYILSIAMNMGNQGNIDKMMRGMGWDMATIERALVKLNDADWTFVQETWDTINSVWPEIAELEKRMTGLEPPKIEAQPYEVRDAQGNVTRTLAGGYYPLVYDPRLSEQGAKQEAGNLGQLFEEGYVRATTPKGHTQARTEGFAAPMLLDFEQVITQHMSKVVKDLTHREAVVTANKIFTNRDIRNVLQETLGPSYEKQMLPWLRSVVNDRNGGSAQGLSDFARWMMTARANVVAATMGFKATTMISQITGLSQSLDKVKGRYLGQAVLEYLRHPIALTNTVRELSGEMRNRSNTLDRDIRDQLRNLTGQNSAYANVQRFAFHGIAIMDTMVTVPTWMGAYRQSLDEGANEETARLEADAAVRLTQGAGGAKDLAAIQRNNELAKSVTMFYSYFSVLYNRMRDMGRDVQEIRDMPRFLSRVFFTVMAPAVLGELILGRGPDDDEDPAAWTIRKVLLYPMMSVPVLRDVVSAIDSGFDYRFSPMANVFDKIGKAATATGKVIEGDMEWGDYTAKVGETMGYVFGVAGTAQMAATGKYLWRVSEGEENPDNIAELLAYALLGKRKED